MHIDMVVCLVTEHFLIHQKTPAFGFCLNAFKTSPQAESGAAQTDAWARGIVVRKSGVCRCKTQCDFEDEDEIEKVGED